LETIPEELLDRPVVGVGLSPGSLRDQLGGETGDRPTLLVFLRHFGCMFCKEAVADLRAAAEGVPDYPEILFFTQGSPRESRAFLRDWPGARAVSDPEMSLYEAFGIRRASFLEALGPRVLKARSRAAAKGHENGPRSGDIWRMPGCLLVEGDRIVWRFEPRHAADHPDFTTIPALATTRPQRVADPG
jgi:hypothetical protein